jgi:hypothetical protein
VSAGPSDLARVLIEAGEPGMVIDWVEGEMREMYADALFVLADPDADPVEQDRARLIRDRLDEAFAELRELADNDEEDG